MAQKNIILITGSRKGIGRDLASYYATSGNTVIGCSRGKSSLDLAQYSHYEMDITDEKAVRMLFSDIRKKHGRLDVLINNAGVNHALAPVALVPFHAAESTLRTNFLGTFLVSREAIKIMMKNSFGRIINLGSMAVKYEEKGEAVYTASKAAIISLSRVLAKEVYQYGITCNVVSPSAIKTDLMDNIDSDALNIILKRNAVPTQGTIDELINTINWLMDKESSKITGQNIYLGGV